MLIALGTAIGASVVINAAFEHGLYIDSQPAPFWFSAFVYFFVAIGIIAIGSRGVRKIISFLRLRNLRMWFMDDQLMVQIPGEKTALPWNAIGVSNRFGSTFIYGVSVPTSTTEVFRIKQDGTTVAMDQGLQDITIDISVVKEGLLRRYIEHYDAGETITFGQVAISKPKLMTDNKSFLWKDVRKINVKVGRNISLETKDGKQEYISGTSEVPNAIILEAFVDYIVSRTQNI